MKHAFDGYNYLLRFEKGEKLVAGLLEFIKEQDVKGGWVSGLGGLQSAILGFYNLDKKRYEWAEINDELELASLSGNIAWSDEEPVLHLHASVGDRSLKIRGGHLKEAVAAGTIEVFIHQWLDGSGLTRSLDESTGLKQLDL